MCGIVFTKNKGETANRFLPKCNLQVVPAGAYFLIPSSFLAMIAR